MKIALPLVATLALTISSATSAAALPLTYSSPGVVGTIDGVIAGGVGAELAKAQALLDMATNTSTNDLGASSCDGADDNFPDSGCRKTNTALDYSGTLTNLLGDDAKIEEPQGSQLTVTGFEYVLAKYDGANAGYVLFYLPAFGDTIPINPDDFWTETAQYDISHLTRFNGATTVPDGGATLGLLGLGLMGLSYVRRRLR